MGERLGEPGLVVLSQRSNNGGFGSSLAYGAWHEAEDVLAEVGGRVGDLDRHSMERRLRLRRLVGRGVRKVGGPTRLLPATHSTGVIEQGDHVVFIARTLWDLALLERLRDVRRSAATVSVWFPEIWPQGLDDRRLVTEAFSMVDHVFVGLPQAVEAFGSIAPNAEIRWLPLATDVARFAPSSLEYRRSIAVIGVGRRDPVQHRTLKQWADDNNKMYIYDTVKGEANDWNEHRDSLAATYRHSSISICNYAKRDREDEIGPMRALPGRLFEGLASGTILVGIPPDEDMQTKTLGQTVVESVAEDGSDLTTVVERCLASAEEYRIRNVVLACNGHDWGHRWRDIIATLGLREPEGLKERLRRLADLGSSILATGC